MSEQKVVNMAESAPAIPPKEEIVTKEVLISAGMNSLNLALAFAGQKNPSTIWQSMIGDRQDAYFYYREVEEKDDAVRGRLEELKLAVLSRDRQITPGDESGQADKVATFVKEQLASIPNFHQILKCLLDAPGYGVAIAEILFDVTAGQVGLIDIKDRPQELFAFGPATQPQIGQLGFLRNRFDMGAGQPMPEEKFLVYTHDKRSGNRRGRPLIRGAFWASWFKRNMMRFWLRFAEKGPGTAAVTYSASASDSEKKQALAAAEAIRDSVAIAVPENFGLIKELLTAARAQNPGTYDRFVDRMDSAIARVMVGQTLTSQGSEDGAGSLALGRIHSETKAQRVEEVAKALETVINDQLIKNLVLWNFGPNVPMPKWSLAAQDSDDLTARSQVDQRLQQMGAPIPLSYARRKYGITEPEGDDDVLQPRSIATPGLLQAAQFSDARREANRGASAVDELLDELKENTRTLFKGRAQSLAATAKGGRR